MARLSLLHLTKTFGAQAAVHDVTLEVRDGELMCLLGPSGCGKTTTLRMIGRCALPAASAIQMNDRSVVALPPEKRPTAMVFQRYNLWPHMTVAGNIAFGLKLRRLTREAIAERVRDVLGLVGLPGFSQKYPHQLSGGEQQRVAVARGCRGDARRPAGGSRAGSPGRAGKGPAGHQPGTLPAGAPRRSRGAGAADVYREGRLVLRGPGGPAPDRPRAGLLRARGGR